MRNSHTRPVLVDAARKSTPLTPVPFGETGSGYNEHWLQRLVHDHPDCLPVDEIEPGFDQPVAVCMELNTKHGPIDNLLMTSDGDLVLVEVKLWRNPEARRKVVAQALDYASCLFEMDYAELEAAVLKAKAAAGERLERLYDLFAERDAKDEASFVDAVNQNLRRGRALILVVGDGIRTETVRLASLLQSHAGAHFTFALVELGVFSLPDNQGLIICPRTLVQTEMISRAIVRIEDKRTTVVPDERKPGATEFLKPLAENLSAEQFYEAMAKLSPRLPDVLRSFIGKVEPLGVYPDFRKSLIFRWDPPEGKSINLGYVTRQGQLWTDAANAIASKDLSHLYVEELAEALGGDVERQSMGEHWYVKSNGRAIRIDAVIDCMDRWIPVIERFMDRLRTRLAEDQ